MFIGDFFKKYGNKWASKEGCNEKVFKPLGFSDDGQYMFGEGAYGAPVKASLAMYSDFVLYVEPKIEPKIELRDKPDGYFLGKHCAFKSCTSYAFTGVVSSVITPGHLLLNTGFVVMKEWVIEAKK